MSLYGVSVCIFKDGRILAISDKDSKYLEFPGDILKRDEIPEHVAIKSVFEKTGYVICIYSPSAYAGINNENKILKTYRGDIVTELKGKNYIWISINDFIERSSDKAYNVAVLKHFGIINREEK